MLYPYMLEFLLNNGLPFNQSVEKYNDNYSKNRYGPQRAFREDLKKGYRKSQSKESWSIERNPGFKKSLEKSFY